MLGEKNWRVQAVNEKHIEKQRKAVKLPDSATFSEYGNLGGQNTTEAIQTLSKRVGDLEVIYAGLSGQIARLNSKVFGVFEVK